MSLGRSFGSSEGAAASQCDVDWDESSIGVSLSESPFSVATLNSSDGEAVAVAVSATNVAAVAATADDVGKNLRGDENDKERRPKKLAKKPLLMIV